MLDDAQIYSKVVELRSISKAAKELNLSPASVSKRITKLEDYFDTPLLYRNTRGISLTHAGKVFYENIKPAVTQVRAAERAVFDMAESTQGELSIACGEIFASHFLAPAIRAYTQDFPETRFNITTADEPISLTNRGMDIYFQWGKLEDTSLVAIKMFTEKVLPVCSPVFAKESDIYNAAKEKLGELNTGLSHSFATSTRKRMTDSLGISTNPIMVDNQLLAKQLSLHHVGVSWVPRFACLEDIKQGKLVDLSDIYQEVTIDCNAVCHTKPSKNERINSFLSCLKIVIGSTMRNS